MICRFSSPTRPFDDHGMPAMSKGAASADNRTATLAGLTSPEYPEPDYTTELSMFRAGIGRAFREAECIEYLILTCRGRVLRTPQYRHI